MSERYYISRGRTSTGQTCYSVQDSKPGAGSDGRLADYLDEGHAVNHRDNANEWFAWQAAEMQRTKGLEWRWNGRCYCWEPPPKPYNPCD